MKIFPMITVSPFLHSYKISEIIDFATFLLKPLIPLPYRLLVTASTDCLVSNTEFFRKHLFVLYICKNFKTSI